MPAQLFRVFQSFLNFNQRAVQRLPVNRGTMYFEFLHSRDNFPRESHVSAHLVSGTEVFCSRLSFYVGNNLGRECIPLEDNLACMPFKRRGFLGWKFLSSDRNTLLMRPLPGLLCLVPLELGRQEEQMRDRKLTQPERLLTWDSPVFGRCP